MTIAHADRHTAEIIEKEVPYLRRYGRALTGSQERGDGYAAAVLDALLRDPGRLDRAIDPKVALFRLFQDIWTAARAEITPNDTGYLAARAQAHLARLTSGTRDVLLLNSLERFAPAQIGQIMRLDTDHVADLLARAYGELAEAVSGRVLIIEDDAQIANDLERIAASMGHEVSGSARTKDAALVLAREEAPELILADIVLADNSTGIEAAGEILLMAPKTPVIFVTGHPEKLLTGQQPEPTFLITKPYSPDQVRSAMSQALFFAPDRTRSDEA